MRGLNSHPGCEKTKVLLLMHPTLCPVSGSLHLVNACFECMSMIWEPISALGLADLSRGSTCSSSCSSTWLVTLHTLTSQFHINMSKSKQIERFQNILLKVMVIGLCKGCHWTYVKSRKGNRGLTLKMIQQAAQPPVLPSLPLPYC